MSEAIAQLLSRCATGDQTAWSAVIKTHAGLVYAIARRCGLREDQCDDVAQSVFATLLRRLDTIRDADALASWLSTTTRREAWRVRRRARLGTGQLPDDLDSLTAESVEKAATKAEETHRLRVALEELGGRCRELLLALFSGDARSDYSAIAGRLGIPIGSIGPTRARCLAKLGELLRRESRPGNPE